MRIEQLYYYFKRFSWIFHVHKQLGQVQIDRPIFLLGNQGDGISFVSRILRRHEKIVSVTGGSNYWTGADEMATVMEPYLPKELRLAGRILKSDPNHAILTQPRSWSYGCNDLVDKYHLTERDYNQASEDRFKQAIKIALARFGKRPGSRFIDKSQVYTLKTRYIQRLLSDANPYFILFTRDPYISCFRAANGKAGDMKRYSKFMSLEERLNLCIEHWGNCMRIINEDSKHLIRFRHYRFEDFLNDVATYSGDMCNFLDLKLSKDMLPGPNQILPYGTKYKMRWHPVRKDVNEKYFSSIPAWVFDLVEDKIGDIANTFGYTNPSYK